MGTSWCCSSDFWMFASTIDVLGIANEFILPCCTIGFQRYFVVVTVEFC